MKTVRWIGAAVCVIVLYATPSQAADTIKIGAILAVSGNDSFLGIPEARTLDMLVGDINARGGINGKKVELIIKDSVGDPEKALVFAKQLIDEEKVFAILGPSTSNETVKIKDLAERGQTILLSCAAAESGADPLAKFVFRTPQKDADAVRKIFLHMKKMNITKIGILSSNSGFGSAGKTLLEKLSLENGIRIAYNGVYDKAATDVNALVAKLKTAKVQAVVNWSIEPAQALVLASARRLGVTAPMYLSHGFGDITYLAAAGAAAEGVIFPAGRLLIADALSDRNPQKRVLLAYKKTYEEKFKEDASAFGGHAYDALKILEQALKAAGPNADREKVRATIENMKGLAGIAGIFNFTPADHNGLGADAFEIVTVKDGKFALLQ